MVLHVFGSLNLDLVCRTPRLPMPGETILGTGFEQVPGGKGANQAVAAARLGAMVRMVGRVGNDAFGQELLANLRAAGVDVADVQVDPETHSGVAAIAVDLLGQNHIIVVPGANGRVNASDGERLMARWATGDGLLLQFEIPLAAVIQAATAAHQQGLMVIVDPAPARTDLPDALFPQITYLTPNQIEAAQLVGFPVTDLPTAQAAARALRQRGVETVIIKLGEQGVWVDSPGEAFHQPAFTVPVVDTVAAGDAFNGGLAVALSEGKNLRDTVKFASATAALSVTQAGAQPSLPPRQAVDNWLQGTLTV